jgi:cytochrome c-type biogenesis protein CcsB
MNRIIQYLSAPWLMGGLFIIMAAAMAMATFVENDYGTQAAKALVYNAWWFELIFFLLAVNMLGNIFNFKMWRRGNYSVLIFHLSFFLIIAGAAITRYIGYEGLLHIREGEKENIMLSYDQHVMAEFSSGGEKVQRNTLSFLSPATPKVYKQTLRAGNEKVRIKSVAFVPNASSRPFEVPGGVPMAGIVTSSRMQMSETFLSPGDHMERAGMLIAFEPDTILRPDIILRRAAGGRSLEVISARPFSRVSMETTESLELESGVFHPFSPGMLYDFGHFRLTMSQFLQSAIMQPVTATGEQAAGLPHAVVFDIRHRKVDYRLVAYGRNGAVGEVAKINLPDGELAIRFGSLPIQLPFSIQLNKFILDRYPGSQSPSGFTSEVTLLDPEHGVDEPHSIFMNNILNHRGYRLYQSSYDTDEKGTVLSVNHDRLGTIITYIGYFLMSLGMLWAIFAPKTRFRSLVNLIDRQNKKHMTIGLFLFVLPTGILASGTIPTPPDKDLAAAFGSVWVQDNGGRVKPLNSLHQEISLKLVKHNSFRGMTADQLVLGMFINPDQWQSAPLITVKEPQLRAILGITEPKAAFTDFFDEGRHYKIHQWAEAAHRKSPSSRNKLEQEIIKVDEQVNVFYLTQMGSLHRLFPSPKDLHLPWYTPTSQPATLASADSIFVVTSVNGFIEAVRTGDNESAKRWLQQIRDYQYRNSDELLPSEFHLKLELLYNRLNVFLWLSTWFFGLGAVLLLIQFLLLLKPGLSLKWIMKVGFALLFLGFIYYTFGLGLRWVIAGHAPWSNGYESMIFVGWSILFAGFVLSRKSDMILPVTGLFTGVVLMVAHLSWMNPHITNLVPVLQSYWLTLHVSVIIAGYGFLALGALLGFMNLIVISLRNRGNFERLRRITIEFTAINEMSLTIGLYLMTIGSFLGGVWANESWGRYWGWDPKETWSLITIVLYAFVLHMRFIPGLKGYLAFNIASLITFGSVIMTYLGVNYYLAGLHSYAGGDPVPIPVFVYYTLAVILLLLLLAQRNERKMHVLIKDDDSIMSDL